ncbi:hypothetical protein ABZV34_27005 [Streptomyces sp. NPDC005195]|uniref:hypothetical protein n=1 Tax=Streptomyces sp. NPDC005195 TaxID=3154561 RepID=UPI0033ABC0E0
MPQFAEGSYVSWDLRDGPVTVEVMVVDRHHITYRSADDYRDMVEATVYSSLAEKTADWRPATAKEAAAFKARFRPAPQNWD